ncbi:MAG: hypothetical protein ABSB26_07895 [Nitrososphaerales archaeon]|jgi:hypothetical protein
MKFAHIQRPLPFVLGISAFAWAIGFSRYFDHWVLFPTFPNILDSLGISLVGAYLLYLALGKSNPLVIPSDVELGVILSVFDDIDPA